jgi:hypothetical protein
LGLQRLTLRKNKWLVTTKRSERPAHCQRTTAALLEWKRFNVSSVCLEVIFTGYRMLDQELFAVVQASPPLKMAGHRHNPREEKRVQSRT